MPNARANALVTAHHIRLRDEEAAVARTDVMGQDRTFASQEAARYHELIRKFEARLSNEGK